MNDQLTQIGDALQRAVATEVRRTHRPRLAPRSPRVAVAVLTAVVAVPAVGYAATSLLSDSQVAASLPQGTRALIGTDPTCTAVVADVEYHCVLASAPSNLGAPAGGSGTATTPGQVTTTPFKGNVRVTVTEPNGTTLIVSADSLPALKHKLMRLGEIGQWKVTTAPATTVTAPALDQKPTTTATATDWTGTVEPTVDASKHVNGGCRAQNAAGTQWECYIGEAAVKQNIISQGFLGQYAPAPGVG